MTMSPWATHSENKIRVAYSLSFIPSTAFTICHWAKCRFSSGVRIRHLLSKWLILPSTFIYFWRTTNDLTTTKLLVMPLVSSSMKPSYQILYIDDVGCAVNNEKLHNKQRFRFEFVAVADVARQIHWREYQGRKLQPESRECGRHRCRNGFSVRKITKWRD